MLIIRPAELADLDAITEVYNEAIGTTTATFDEPVSLQYMITRIVKAQHGIDLSRRVRVPLAGRKPVVMNGCGQQYDAYFLAWGQRRQCFAAQLATIHQVQRPSNDSGPEAITHHADISLNRISL